MSHTKEPWILRQGNEIGVADKSDTQSYGMLNVIARVDKYDFENWQENARRIVACVNACQLIPTEWLEKNGAYAIPTPSVRDAIKERETYRDLCAELIRSARAKLDAGNLNEHVKAKFELEAVITKAESILGEKNGTSN